jgi:hypothetical protein
MIVNFLIGYLSLFLNDNFIQIFGFLYSFILIYLSNKKYIFFSIPVITLAYLFSIVDITLMSSKILLLSFMLMSLKYINIKVYYSLFSKCFIAISLFIFYFFDFLQYWSGTGAPGVFDTSRLSGGMWDPNYFSLFILLLCLFYPLKNWLTLPLIFLAQSTTFIFVFIANYFHINVLKFSFTLLILLFFIFPFTFDSFYNYFDNQYIKDRLFSFNMRVGWAESFFLGDDLVGIAPHNSFISGLKKSPFLTCIYFILLLIFSKNRRNLYSLLVVSMTTDVILGPVCFLIPFLVQTKSDEK